VNGGEKPQCNHGKKCYKKSEQPVDNRKEEPIDLESPNGKTPHYPVSQGAQTGDSGEKVIKGGMFAGRDCWEFTGT